MSIFASALSSATADVNAAELLEIDETHHDTAVWCLELMKPSRYIGVVSIDYVADYAEIDENPSRSISLFGVVSIDDDMQCLCC